MTDFDLTHPEVRHSLGLPPMTPSWVKVVRLAMTPLLVLTTSAILGVIGGSLHHRLQQGWLRETVLELTAAMDPDEVRNDLATMEQQRATLTMHPPSRLLCARGYMQAASTLPVQQPYYRAALEEVQAAVRLAGPDRDTLGFRLVRAELECMLLLELERWHECRAAFRRFRAAIDDYAAADLRAIERDALRTYVLWWVPDGLRVADDDALRGEMLFDLNLMHDNGLAYLQSQAPPPVGNGEEALALATDHEYGNGVAIYTRDGDTARNFASRVQVGMVGINVPIPVPLAYHTFGGWKRSGFGDLNQHGPDSIRFYTKTKTVTSRWPSGIRHGAEFVIPTMS